MQKLAKTFQKGFCLTKSHFLLEVFCVLNKLTFKHVETYKLFYSKGAKDDSTASFFGKLIFNQCHFCKETFGS